MSNNAYEFAAIVAALAVIAGKGLDWIIGLRNRKSDTDLKDAEADRSDFESAVDVARLRLEDFNRVTQECQRLRDDMDAMRTSQKEKDDNCERKIAALNEIVQDSASRYNRLRDDYEDVRRQLETMRRGLSQAGGSST